MANSAAQPATADGVPLVTSFWKLWASSGFSNLADGVFKIALPLMAIQLTKSPALIAGLAVAATLPWLLFALTAGALADRLDRRKLMLWANLSRAVLPAVLIAVIMLDLGSIWALYLVALMVGCGNSLRHVSSVDPAPGGEQGPALTRQRPALCRGTYGQPVHWSAAGRAAGGCGAGGRDGRSDGAVADGGRSAALAAGQFPGGARREDNTSVRHQGGAEVCLEPENSPAWGTMPLGAAAGGVLAQWLGLQAMFGVMGVLTLILLVMMPILNNRAIAAAEEA
ncbi:MAG: MFS transporter [Arthrobacter sp.]